MKTSNTNILFVLSVFAGLYSDVVTARPEPEKLIARAVNCNALTVVLNKIPALGTPATSFCSSYLKIPLATTVTQTEKPTTTLTVPVTTTSIDPNCIAPRVKRQPTAIRLDGRKVAGVPVALASFAAAELTSACGCLNLKPKVTVTTTTTEPTLTVTETKTATTTVCGGCTPVGQPCIFEHPEYCCSQACACISGVCNCFDFGK